MASDLARTKATAGTLLLTNAHRGRNRHAEPLGHGSGRRSFHQRRRNALAKIK